VLEFRILGPLEVLADGTPVLISGRNQRAVLTLLLLRANEPVSTDQLIDHLWGEHPPRTATTSLQNTVSQLRKLLGPDVVHTRPTGYSLVLDGHDLDLERFERLVRQSRTVETAQRVELLREALALWRGAALSDSELEEFAQPEIQRLEELRLGALEERIATELELGGGAELVAELESLVARHPLRERLRSGLMLALYRSGRQADALSAYHDTRRKLVDELGIEPSHEVEALYRSILRQERTLVSAAAPPLEDHYDEVRRALAAGRLVPVLGPGACGVGADELAALLAERFQLDATGRALAYVSQVVAARNGTGPLHDELYLALDRDCDASPLHDWLSALPGFFRGAGLPQQLIVSTAFDTGLERVFEAAGEELDVATYISAGRDRGKFLHLRPDGEAVVIAEPNAYTDFDFDRRTVLLKIHGHVDRSGTRHWESFTVSEDDHIDYLVGGDAGALPVQLGARLRRSHLLFLGYGVGDWSLRVFLRRVWGADRLAYRSWAVQPGADPVARELWRERGAEVYEVELETYANELMRLATSDEDGA
jgi:DNA-binding SARP family transcriptional activator